jgi:hypothetical protein
MTVLAPPPPRLPAVAVREGVAPENLLAIRRPGVAAAIWTRAPDPAFAAWIDGLPPERLPELRAALPAARAADAVLAACESAGDPAGPERDQLAGDVAALAAIFARLSGGAMLRLRLDVVSTDRCRRFHVDNVRLRLLCKYRGAGTEYGVAGCGATPDRIARLPRGGAAVFRGLRWPGERTGLVHRSPPIAGTGETRLLLAIDPFEPDDAE